MWNICFYLIIWCVKTVKLISVDVWPYTTFFNTSCTLCSAGKGRAKARGAHMTLNHILYGFRPVSLSLFSPLSICWAKNTHTLTRVNPTGKVGVRFTLSSKINDTSNVADGCNQKFKQQAASLSLSLFFFPPWLAIAKESCNSVRCVRPGLCVSLSYHHLICSSLISYRKS